MFEVGAAAVETAKKGKTDKFFRVFLSKVFGRLCRFKGFLRRNSRLVRRIFDLFFKMCYCHFLPSRLLLRSEVLHKEPCPEDEFWSLLWWVCFLNLKIYTVRIWCQIWLFIFSKFNKFLSFNKPANHPNYIPPQNHQLFHRPFYREPHPRGRGRYDPHYRFSHPVDSYPLEEPLQTQSRFQNGYESDQLDLASDISKFS